MMNFDNYLFRCSSLGKLMVPPKDKGAKERGELSETAKSYLVGIYAEAKYGRRKEIESRYFEKGIACEEAAITLYSRFTKMYFTKNTVRLANDFVTGEPDLHDTKLLSTCTTIIDAKNAWDIHTFLKVRKEGITDEYEWQGLGYEWLAGPQAQTFKLAYTLSDAPQYLIDAEIRRLGWKLQPGTIEYIDAVAEVEHSMTFQDIPLEERVIEITVPRDQAKIDLIPWKVIAARKWLNEFDKQVSNYKM